MLGYRSKAWRARLIEPCLDLMQTVPTFAYLIPILVLFGIGPVVGMVASAIYAVPPMVRNVMLGLERVPVEIVESATCRGRPAGNCCGGCRYPTAMPAILIGVNQTIMAGLSMVVIAAMVGGAPDIGLEVFNTMKKAQFGESILPGLVIALLAMIMDRISRGLAESYAPILDPHCPRRGFAACRLVRQWRHRSASLAAVLAGFAALSRRLGRLSGAMH